MAELNYDPRIPAEPTSRTWRLIKFVIIALWAIAALWAVRVLTADDDTAGMGQGAIAEQVDVL